MKASSEILPKVGTGYMKGKVIGGPMPDEIFDTHQVVIVNEQPIGVLPYWAIVGTQDDPFPPIPNGIAILIDQDVRGKEFNLKGNTKVRVTFSRKDHFGFAFSISGSLKFTSLPETRHAVGVLDCLVQKNDEMPFQIKVKFDIHDRV